MKKIIVIVITLVAMSLTANAGGNPNFRGKATSKQKKSMRATKKVKAVSGRTYKVGSAKKRGGSFCGPNGCLGKQTLARR